MLNSAKDFYSSEMAFPLKNKLKFSLFSAIFALSHKQNSLIAEF